MTNRPMHAKVPDLYEILNASTGRLCDGTLEELSAEQRLRPDLPEIPAVVI